MGQVTYVLLLALLTLSFPSADLSGSLRSALYPRSADAVDMDEDDNTAGEEQIPAPSSPCHLLEGIPRRGIDLSALPFVTRQLIPHPHGRGLGRRGSSAAIVYQAEPLYQALQVYRF